MMKNILALLLVMVLFTAVSPLYSQADESAPVLNVIKDTILEKGLNFVTGTYGTCINGQTFQNDSVVTFNGYQYAVYWKDIRTNPTGAPSDQTTKSVVARRKLPDGVWEEIVFPDYAPSTANFVNFEGKTGNGNVHNVIAIGISAADGVIHLAYDHHVNGLHYRKSIPGLATNPDSLPLPWTSNNYNSLFGATTSKLVDTPINDVSYPLFFSKPDGGLNFVTRIGYSGNGRWVLYEYSNSEWKLLGMMLDSAGSYGTSPGRCAYPNNFRYDSNGRLHATWVWRENGTTLLGNHDLNYSYSDDGGRTWFNNAGAQIAQLDGNYPSTNTISINSPGIVAYPIKYNWGLMNQGTMFVDSKNRPHTVTWRNPDAAASGTVDKNKWRYYHYWRDEGGIWHEYELPFWGRKPQTMLDDEGNMYVLFGQGQELNYDGMDYGGKLSIARATEASGWTDWKLTHVYPDKTFHGEPLFDLYRWENEGILSAYFQEKPAVAGMPSNLHVIDFAPGAETVPPVYEVGFELPPPPDPLEGLENLALKGTVIGFSNQQVTPTDNNPAVNMIDGNLSNRWAAEGYPQWIEIDLGSDKEVHAAKLYNYLNRAYRYRIEGKADGGEYTTIIDRTNNSSSTSPLTDILTTPVNVRYIKLTVTGFSSSTWVSLHELEIYGKDLDAPPDDYGYIVESVTISNGTVNAELKNNSGSDATVSILCGVYDDTNKMVRLAVKNMAVAEVDSVEFNNLPEGNYWARVMIWKDWDLMPLALGKSSKD